MASHREQKPQKQRAWRGYPTRRIKHLVLIALTGIAKNGGAYHPIVHQFDKTRRDPQAFCAERRSD